MAEMSTDSGRIEPSFQREKYVWLRGKLYLDLLMIDEELIQIPSLIQEAGEMTSTAIEIREAAKDDLDKTTAQVADTLRCTPNPKGKDRSESTIQSELPLSPLIEEKKKAYGNARHDAALWSTLTESLRRKDSAIRVVADLLNSGFLTTSSIMSIRQKEIRATARTQT